MKYRYLFLSETYDMYGTNDAKIAAEMRKQGPVLDCETGVRLASEHVEAHELLEVPEDFYKNPKTGAFWSEEQV